MREVAAREHELGTHLLDQPRERLDRLGLVVPAEVQVGDVEVAGLHDFRSLSAVPLSWGIRTAGLGTTLAPWRTNRPPTRRRSSTACTSACALAARCASSAAA